MIKLYDCFMFSNETDLLKLRILEGINYVEKFIIIESKETHSGISKILYSEEMKDFLENYKDKIIHYVIEQFPKIITHYPKILFYDVKNTRPKDEFWNWMKEGYQRALITEYLPFINSSDILIVSDLDEIPNYEKLKYDILNNRNNILNEKINYVLPTYVYNIHYRLDNYNSCVAFTSPARLLNKNNINNFRFGNTTKILDGYFTHLNRFLKPQALIIKEVSIAEGKGGIIPYEEFKHMRKDILKKMLGGNYNGTNMTYKNHPMPKNINVIYI